jgi:hypothetical protein
MGWNVERMTRFRPPDDFSVPDDPVLYVEALTAPLFAEALGLRLSEPPLDWLPNLPAEYRRREVRLTTLGDARRLAGPLFMKPPNDKSFRAAVYDGSELPREYPDDMPILVSDVVRWRVEFRCFILDRAVRTFSVYLRDGQLQREAGFPHSDEEEAAVRSFTSRLLADARVALPRASPCPARRSSTWASSKARAGRLSSRTPRGAPASTGATRRRSWRYCATPPNGREWPRIFRTA